MTNVTENQSKIISMLSGTKRTGIDNLVEHLVKHGFFTDPASTKFHSVYEGGLAKHSIDVYNEFCNFNSTVNLELNEDTLIITSLMHDLCKMNRYILLPNGNYIYNKKNQALAHGITSAELVKEYIDLTELERTLIVFHMGMWMAKECNKYGEYSIHELIRAWNFHKSIRYIYFADEIALGKSNR